MGFGVQLGYSPGVRADELINFDLDESERRLLRWGLVDWGGPARCTEEMAVAMGFAGVADLFGQRDRLVEALRSSKPMTRFDWCRVLLATEVCFVSAVLGSGLDWHITFGRTDAESIEVLRRVQQKLISEVGELIGKGLGTRPQSRRPRSARETD